MVRKLSWLMALLALNCSMGAFALGLGDIDLHSALNQPINADIELQSVRPEDADSIKVLLGSAEDFERAGLERPYLLNQLRFLVVAKGKGHYRIHVSSEQAIREPFLDFLIQVTWRGGQLLREYTVLLDPPVLMPAPVQVITAPVTRAAAPEPAAAAVPTPAPSSAPIAAAPQPVPAPPKPEAQPSPPAPAPQPEPSAAESPIANEYGPVRRNQTLWSIANRARPNRSVSVDQMMQAILKANPDAFINNNVNNLKAGQILRIPSASEVEAINAATARAATQQQNEDWRNRRAAPAAPMPEPAQAPEPAAEMAEPKAAPEAAQKPAPAPAAQKPPVAAKTPPQPEAQLKVMAPTRADATKPAAAGGTGTAPEAAATAPSAVGADIHKELALATEAVETQRQETDDLRTRLTDLEQQITTMQKMMTIKDEQLAALQAKSAAEPQQATGVANNPTTLAMIGIIAVLLAAFLWLAMRSRQVGVPVTPREIRVEPRQSPAPAQAAARVESAAVAAGAVTAAAVRAANKNVEPISTAPQQAVRPVAEAHPESDPLSEADIYLAYGRYQQAEDLIKEAMHRDHNPELRLKLLEIYYAAKNATGFEDVARDLRHDVGADHQLWQRVLPMGREICPYSLLFGVEQNDEPAATETVHAAATATAPDAYDFDLGGSEDTVLTRARLKQEPLNLDVGLGGEPAEDSLDEVGTKLDLARAYIDMGDADGARSILGEVLQEGSAAQKNEANELLQRLTQ